MTEIILYNLQPLFFSLVHMRGRWKCGSGNIGTVQNAGWKMREWKHREVNEYGKLGLTYCLTQHDTNQKCINNIPYSMQTHRNERVQNFFQSMTFSGAWSLVGMKSSVCFCKRHILACIYVVWAIFREDRLGPPESRSGKRQKVMRGSYRKDMSPLTQCLNYSSACDKLWLTDYNNNVRHKSSNSSKNTRLTPCCTTALLLDWRSIAATPAFSTPAFSVAPHMQWT